MNRGKRFKIAVLSAVMAVSALSGCGTNSENDLPTDATDIETGVNVNVAEVSERDIETKVTYTGELTANNFAYATSKVSAKVSKINGDVGTWVNQGDTLVVLDASDYEYQLKQAEASYVQAEAAYNSAQTALENVGGANEQTLLQLKQGVSSAEIAYNDAKLNLERQSELYEKGAISLVTYESAKSAFDSATLAYESAKENYEICLNVIIPGNEKSAKSGVQTAEAALKSASLAIEQAKTNISNTTITAPISGYITAKNVALGQFAAAGAALFTICDSSNLDVEIRVTEAVVPHIKNGSRALVTISSASLEGIEGKVSMVNPIKDAQTGMYKVKVSVPNKSNSLKAGMFADVTIVTEQSKNNVISVPSNALMNEGDEYYVYVVENDIAQKRVVTIDISDGEYTCITGGLDEGELVVTLGKEYLSETNNLVNIVD